LAISPYSSQQGLATIEMIWGCDVMALLSLNAPAGAAPWLHNGH